MRISSKARYGMAAMIYIGENGNSENYIPILTISEKLGISKIYLEQVFSLLKRANLVNSIKGSQGGYQLSKPSKDITAYDILSAIETSLFEETEKSLSSDRLDIENSMADNVWNRIHTSLCNTLKEITLEKLIIDATNNRNDNFMFFI